MNARRQMAYIATAKWQIRDESRLIFESLWLGNGEPKRSIFGSFLASSSRIVTYSKGK